MKRLKTGCGYLAFCMLTIIGMTARAQVVLRESDSGNDTDNGSDRDTGTDTNPGADANVDTAVEVAPEPAEPPADDVLAVPVAPTKSQVPENGNPRVETVPEAVEVEGVRPATHVDITPAVAPGDVVSDGKRKILTGTWTKSILFSTDDGGFRFQPRGSIQPRFTLSVNSDDNRNDDEPLMGTGFALQRARFGFQAWLFKWGHFYLDTEWKTGAGQLVDSFVDLGPNNGERPVGVRVGIFRPFLSRQLLHSSTQLAMIDYARAWTELDQVPVADDAQAGGFSYTSVPLNRRQLGIAVQGLAFNGLEYTAGIWNGSDGYTADADFMYGGRIAVHPTGLAGGAVLRSGDESDTDVSTAPAAAIGLAAYIEDRNDAVADLPGMLPYEDYKLRAGADAAFKYAGVSLAAEFFIVTDWAKQEVINDYLKLHHRDAPGMGAYFQAAYMVVPKRLEVAGRFDLADESISIRGIRFYPTAGLTYFLFGNNLKAQFQYRVNIGTGYESEDAMYTPVTHDVIFLLQASI